MSELILCNDELTSLPLQMTGTGINIYSLEELCYYINSNIYFIEKDFMSEDLCTWISNNVKREELGAKLRNMMREEAPLSTFIACILTEVGYCSNKEIAQVVMTLKELEEKSDFECEKIRADRLLERKKYIASIFEYRRLLELAEENDEDKILIGNLWHNLGCSYSKLFLFQEAAKCFEKGYLFNKNKASLKQCLFAYRCFRDEVGFDRVCSSYGLSDLEILEIRNEITMASRSEEMVTFEHDLQEIANSSIGNTKKEMNALHDIIQNWKEDYRLLCRS